MTQARIFSHGKAQAGKEAERRRLVLELIESSKSDKGTDIYEAFETADGKEIIFRIQYATQEDFEEHLKNKHLALITSEVRSIIDGEIRIWNVKQILPE